MNSIEKRIEKLERTTADANPLEDMTDEELYRRLHASLLSFVNGPDEAFAAKCRQDLDDLEQEVTKHVKFELRPDIAAAIASNRAVGVKKEPWHTDWIALATEWNLPCIANKNESANHAS